MHTVGQKWTKVDEVEQSQIKFDKVKSVGCHNGSHIFGSLAHIRSIKGQRGLVKNFSAIQNWYLTRTK